MWEHNPHEIKLPMEEATRDIASQGRAHRGRKPYGTNGEQRYVRQSRRGPSTRLRDDRGGCESKPRLRYRLKLGLATCTFSRVISNQEDVVRASLFSFKLPNTCSWIFVLL
ncbi:unnamed protein product [Cuscuta epithymum]|uniref:Uncharacterized protein n=1 Tax=Cuscuta epithymum TaxID=186058 RepID=A0AAV0EDZ1_9ASTE|nr:unnamed protein product [Cuscuta epithymum]